MRRLPARVPRALLVVWSMVAVAGTTGTTGCGAPKSTVMCTSDMECGTGACMMGTCLPFGTDRMAAVEIVPRTDSESARTDHPGVALGPGPLTLTADDRVILEGIVVDSPDAHIVLLTPSPIPGQADFQFETDLADSRFQLGVGQSLLETQATLWLLPSMQTVSGLQPPIPFLTPLQPNLSLTFPASSELMIVRGVLHDSLDSPPLHPFVARAFVGTTVVSNLCTTDDKGAFQLFIAPGAIPQTASGMVTVELTPSTAETENAGVRFRTGSIPVSVGPATGGTAAPRVFRMPAFVTPAPLRFTVAEDTTKKGIPDVTVRFRSESLVSLDGAAVHERELRTDGNGEVEVALIAGTATQPMNYQVAILPPPNSPYAGRCIPAHAVTIVGNGAQPQYSNTFTLVPKVTLEGTVRGNDGSAAASVAVTATPLATDANCLSARAPISSTTLRSGHYQILLDPGSYRLDVDPPSGAPHPRLTEDGDRSVLVSNDAVTSHDIDLPAGEVVQGVVQDTDGLPLSAAGIKFFEVLCEGATCLGPARIAPALRSQTRTEMDGTFRAVLPVAPPR